MLKRGELYHFTIPARALLHFSDAAKPIRSSNITANALPMRQLEYLKLVDSMGRLVVRGKRGRIDPLIKPILTRLGLSTEQWFHASTAFKQHYKNGNLRLKQSA